MRQHMKDYIEFGKSGAARSVRLLAEYMRAMEAIERLKDHPMITVFGSARLDEESPGWQLAEEFGKRSVEAGYGVITGGASGIMMAANRGAYEEARKRGLAVEDYSIGCAITLPFEESKNVYLGTQLDFHYFFVRKFFLCAYSRGYFYFDGGGGTRDEFWEIFCLIQTGKMEIVPIVAVGDEAVWKSVKADLEHMAGRGTISPPDCNIPVYVETADEAVAELQRFYRRLRQVFYDKINQRIELQLRESLGKDEVKALQKRFADVAEFEWDAAKNALHTTQFNFRSYSDLYDIVDAINEG